MCRKGRKKGKKHAKPKNYHTFLLKTKWNLKQAREKETNKEKKEARIPPVDIVHKIKMRNL